MLLKYTFGSKYQKVNKSLRFSVFQVRVCSNKVEPSKNSSAEPSNCSPNEFTNEFTKEFTKDLSKGYSKEAIYNSLNSLADDIKHTSSEFNEIVNNAVKEMEKKKFNMIKAKIIVCIIGVIIILALYDVITSWMSGQVNVITEKSLDDEELKKKIVITCQDTIKDLVHAKQTQDDVIQLLKVAVISLTDDKEVQKQVAELLEKCVIELAHNENVQNKLIELLEPVVVDLSDKQQIKDGIKQLLITSIEEISQDKSVHDHCGNLIKESLYVSVFGKTNE